MNKLFTLLLIFFVIHVKAQSLYYPPITGSTWDTVSSASLGWCQERVDSLFNYLQTRNTNGFILLKDGKIALEKYFGTFTQTSTNTWASAGKSLVSMLTGIAQEKGIVNISDSVTKYLGQGWTSSTVPEENHITIKNLITMTSGLDDNPTGVLCSNNSTSFKCLQYLAPPDTRWAYHTGAYRKMQDVIDSASGLDINAFTDAYIGTHIGMGGTWSNYTHSSTVRDAARFGLLALGRGIWATDTLLHDMAYYNAMTNTSQSFNLSYGYLWWLNGKASFMAPGSQTVYPATLMSNAPVDMFAALGAEDQKIYVVPSENMVVVRLGTSAYAASAAFSPFDNELWGYIDSLSCTVTAADKLNDRLIPIVYPNPASHSISIRLSNAQYDFVISDVIGRKIYKQENNFAESLVSTDNLLDGIYFILIYSGKEILNQKIIVSH